MLKLSITCCTIFFFLNFTIAQNQLSIVNNSLSNYVIAIRKNADSNETKAAKVLQQYIAKISHVTLPINSDETNNSANTIFVGATNKVSSSDTSGLGDDGYLIKSQGNSLILTGGKRRGVLYSVYVFLSDYLGCNYLSVRAIEIPSNATITIKTPIYNKSVPTFNYRMAHFIEGVSKEYCDWHRLNYFMEDWGLWAHSFKTLLPQDQYFAAHPEYFALVNGKRIPGQPDLSNPDVLRIVTDNLRKMISANPSAKYWSVSQNDNNNYCQCPNCKKLDDEQGSHQGSLLTFINAVAKNFPEKTISTLAYNYSLTPPRTLKPEKNVIIMLTTGHDRLIPIPNTPNDTFNIYFKKWASLTSNIFVWDYVAGFNNALSPFPDMYTLQPNIKYFSENNVSSVFEEGIGTIQGEFSELKCFLVSELMWNKNLNFDDTLQWFVNNYYGKAGGNYIVQYTKLLNDNAVKGKIRLLAASIPQEGKTSYLSNNSINVYKNLFKSALSATGNDSVHAKRILKEYVGVLYAELENNKPSPGNAPVNKKYYSDLLNEWYIDTKSIGIVYLNESRNKTDDYYKQYSDLMK